MLRKYFLSIMVFICSCYLTLIPLSAQEKDKIIINDLIDEELQTENDQYKNFPKPHTIHSYSEEIHARKDTIYQEPIIGLFWEVFGKPFGSLNLDIRITKSSHVSLGVVFYSVYTMTSDYSLWVDMSQLEDGEEVEVHCKMPNVMYYYLMGEKNKRLEIGGGISYRPVWDKYVNGDFPLAFHGVIGFRYQKSKGFFFRVGLTPSYFPKTGFLHSKEMSSFLGVSFGFSL